MLYFSDDVAQVQILIHDLLEVRSVVEHVVDVVVAMKNRRDDEISKTFTGEKELWLDVELHKNYFMWDDFFDMKFLFDSQNHSLDRPIEMLTMETFFEIDSGLGTLLFSINSPRSIFQKEPELVAPILLSLSKYVESLINIIKANRADGMNDSVMKISKVPCRLADAIKAYFIPTLFNRLGEIEILLLDYGKFSWYNKINQIFKDPFNPDGYVKYDKKLMSCVTSKQLERIMSSCYPDTGGFGTKAFYDYKNLACSQKDLSRIKDKSGIEDDYYYGGVNGSCIIDYFSLVRRKLEREFGNAYKKVQPFCMPALHVQNSTKTLTGDSQINLLSFIIIEQIIYLKKELKTLLKFTPKE